ncbi:hypothetical protein F2Q70_00009803 [Brassica cretica]|uniref:Uncharacterized protein n=1 Tax=Brassica cretica TaxID=69181 RepID=A0A8S9M8X3_BRACR|nr:hypothetical protein F2Q70_00009803 [Brassica cretica]
MANSALFFSGLHHQACDLLGSRHDIRKSQCLIRFVTIVFSASCSREFELLHHVLLNYKDVSSSRLSPRLSRYQIREEQASLLLGATERTMEMRHLKEFGFKPSWYCRAKALKQGLALSPRLSRYQIREEQASLLLGATERTMEMRHLKEFGFKPSWYCRAKALKQGLASSSKLFDEQAVTGKLRKSSKPGSRAPVQASSSVAASCRTTITQ